MYKKTVALIPVRGGSKSIPLKNIKSIAGKPLVCWSVEAAMNCDDISEVYISTDSDKIRNVVDKYLSSVNNINKRKVKCILRSDATATDTASTESVMMEFAESYNFNMVVLIQATSPTVRTVDLVNGLKKFNGFGYESLLSVVRQKRFNWEEKGNGLVEPLNYNYLNRPRRQEFTGYLVENGAFYITSKENLLQSNCRISGKIGYYEMPESSYYELDEPMDWAIIENILQQQITQGETEKIKNDFIVSYNSNKEALNQIKLVITDCDGVLTDGGMYYDMHGNEWKKFNTKDGLGVRILQECGLKVGIITGEDTDIVTRRAKKLKISEVHLGISNKMEVVNQLIKKYDLNLHNIAFIGDDINDKEVIMAVGFGCCTADAVDDVKSVATYITKRNGGQGAFREIADLILYKQ